MFLVPFCGSPQSFYLQGLKSFLKHVLFLHEYLLLYIRIFTVVVVEISWEKEQDTGFIAGLWQRRDFEDIQPFALTPFDCFVGLLHLCSLRDLIDSCLRLGCWESRQPQNTPERKFYRSLEVVFLVHED